MTSGSSLGPAPRYWASLAGFIRRRATAAPESSLASASDLSRLSVEDCRTLAGTAASGADHLALAYHPDSSVRRILAGATPFAGVQAVLSADAVEEVRGALQYVNPHLKFTSAMTLPFLKRINPALVRRHLSRTKPEPEALAVLAPSWEGTLDDLVHACSELV